MRQRFKPFGLLLLLLAVDAVFFSMINPTRAYAWVVIIGFGLLVLTIYVIFGLLVTMIAKIVPLSDLLRKRLVRAATLLCGLLIAMQSIGQLSFKDLLALVPFVLVLAFYFSYQNKQTGK